MKSYIVLTHIRAQTPCLQNICWEWAQKGSDTFPRMSYKSKKFNPRNNLFHTVYIYKKNG